MRQFKDKHAGETCVVIGNGPSLEKTPLHDLAKKYPTFGSNRIYTYPFVPTYYAICDIEMAHACIVDLPGLGIEPENIFLPRSFPLPGANLIDYTVKYNFSFDPEYEIVIGGTVTYVLLQLAYYMGFTTVLLVGVDHRYDKAEQGGKPGSKFIAAGDDPDHFQPKDGGSYFTPGRVFNRPEIKATSLMYQYARNIFDRDGRKIINLTPGSNLLVYDNDKISNWI